MSRTEKKLAALATAIEAKDWNAARAAVDACEALANDLADAGQGAECDALMAAFEALARQIPARKVETVGQGIARIMRQNGGDYAAAKRAYFCPEGRKSFRF